MKKMGIHQMDKVAKSMLKFLELRMMVQIYSIQTKNKDV